MSSLAGSGNLRFTEHRTRGEAPLPPGTPVVVVDNLHLLKETGLPTPMRFGIVTDNGAVILQECVSDNFKTPEFKIVKQKWSDFCPITWHLFTISPENHAYNLLEANKQAQTEIGMTYKTMRSFPGDDFVRECLSGHPAYKASSENPSIGQHWWTPLYYNVEELQQELQNNLRAIGWNVEFSAPPESMNVECLHFKHHGIVIEDNWVIHFARCRVPNSTNQIKLDSIDTFCNITPYAEPGGPCPYEDDIDQARQLHRNRAVWILFHAKEWGSYNLFTNNCEHMSRACKVGRKQSAQVKNGVAQAALAALCFFLPGGIIARIAAALGTKVILDKIRKLLPQSKATH